MRVLSRCNWNRILNLSSPLWYPTRIEFTLKHFEGNYTSFTVYSSTFHCQWFLQHVDKLPKVKFYSLLNVYTLPYRIQDVLASALLVHAGSMKILVISVFQPVLRLSTYSSVVLFNKNLPSDINYFSRGWSRNGSKIINFS